MAIDTTCQYGMKGLPVYGPVALVEDYDISNGAKSWQMGNQSMSFPLHSWQVVFTGVADGFDGVVKLESSNNCEDWCDTPELNGSNVISGNIDTAAGSRFLVNQVSFGAFNRITLEPGTITTGTISIYAIAKP